MLTPSHSSLDYRHFAPPDEYEGKHRFDPTASWTAAEERAIIRKCDLKITLFICICFAALQLDRGNISSANSDNFLNDLGLTTADFNNGQSIFYCTFLFAELPSQLIGKKLGVERWVPFQMMAWSLVAISQCKLTNKTGFFITRALLGILEGGFIPDAVLMLSYFFTTAELAIRLSFFWVTLTITTIIQALLAAAILKLRGTHGWAGWQYLFLIEGLITLAIGATAAVYLPASPTQTRGGARGKSGWFTEREETIIVTRVLRDDPTKSSMHNRQGLTLRDLKKAFGDVDMYPLYLLGLTTYIGPGTVSAYLSLTIKGLGFSTFHTNLLTIPYNVLNLINNLALTFLSKKTGERTIVASLGSWWQLILIIAIVAIPDSTGAWPKYALLSLYLAYPYAHPILVGWNSANSGSVRTRSVSASTYNISVQIGSIISSQIYQPHDKPYYHKGNRAILGITVFNLVCFLFTKAYLVLRNRSKAARWNALTREEQDHYLATTTDEGNRRLDFQFKH